MTLTLTLTQTNLSLVKFNQISSTDDRLFCDSMKGKSCGWSCLNRFPFIISFVCSQVHTHTHTHSLQNLKIVLSNFSYWIDQWLIELSFQSFPLIAFKKSGHFSNFHLLLLVLNPRSYMLLLVDKHYDWLNGFQLPSNLADPLELWIMRRKSVHYVFENDGECWRKSASKL